MRFERLTSEDGVAIEAVLAIHQDDLGFMWFGTDFGLYRYDGYSVKAYKNDPDDPESLSTTEVRCLLSDSRHALWVGTKGGGLDRFDRATETFVHHRYRAEDPRSLSSDDVLSLVEDSGGAIWIGTGNGLNRFDPATGTFRRFQRDSAKPGSFAASIAAALHVDRAGRLWIGTDNGLARFEPGDESFVFFSHDPEDPHSLNHPGVVQIVEDSDGLLWLGTLAGLNRFDPGSGLAERQALESAADSQRIDVLWLDRRGTLWMGSNEGRGLARFDLESGSLVHSRSDPADPESLKSDLVTSLYEDSSGVLWIGSYAGVSKYDTARDAFVTYRRQKGAEQTLSSSQIWSVVEDSAKVLWVGTAEDGLDRVDRERGTVVNYSFDGTDPDGLQSGPVTVLYEDRAHSLWVGTWGGGLGRFDPATQSFLHHRRDPDDSHSLISDRVQSILEDKAGRLWVATLDGINYLDPETARFVRYPRHPKDPEALGQDQFYAVVEDRSGDLWFGSATTGLYRLIAGSERWQRFRADAAPGRGPVTDRILSLLEDRSGSLWIGTFGGLSRLDPSRQNFVHYRAKDGLAHEMVVGLLEDEEGHIWLAAGRTLSRFDPRGNTFKTFDAGDGLQDGVFFLVASYRSPSGEMFFGGAEGLNAFFPGRIEDDERVPPVVITDFKLFNKSLGPRRGDPDSPLAVSILETEEIVLSHSDYVFSFEFAALLYSNPQESLYRYRLDGFDRDWIAADSGHRQAPYSNVPPGTYTFRVEASSQGGAWSDEGSSMAITILPPPWRTGWAYALYLALCIAAGWGVFGMYRRKLERERQINRRLREVDKLKDEFLANTSHELRTPLFGMVGLAESLIERGAEMSPETVKFNLGMIVASGRRLAALVDDVLDFSRLKEKDLKLQRRPVDLRALTHVVLTLVRPLAVGKKLTLSNTIDPELPLAWADEDRLQQILLNLVGNAIKFTDGGTVEIGAEREGERLVVRVRDTGIGIPPEQQQKIFEPFEQADSSTERHFSGTGLGLAVSERLVALHGGEIWVDSSPGKGSTFFFSLPIASGERSVESTPHDLPRRFPVALEAAAPPEETVADVEALRILVVDDEPVNRQVLLNHLSSQGYGLAAAATGPEALDLIARRDFDLVLLDVMMPRMSGYEVCERLRKKRPLEELPVIFLTAKNEHTDRIHGFEVGANDYLAKPVARDELLARVRTHLELRAAHATLRHQHRQLEQQAIVLERQAAELEARNAELMRVTYTVCHDFKNPLTTIHLFLGELESELGTGTARSAADIRHIRTAAKTMKGLMDGLAAAARSRCESRGFEPVDLAEIIDRAAKSLAEALAELAIHLRIVADLPLVWGNGERLLELIQILLENAVKFSRPGVTPAIEIGLRRAGEESVFFVQDNGIGILPRYHRRVFELFEQLDPRAEGTGIGLAMAQHIVKAHGGRIWVESEGEGHGSTFCFTLPGTDLGVAREGIESRAPLKLR